MFFKLHYKFAPLKNKKLRHRGLHAQPTREQNQRDKRPGNPHRGEGLATVVPTVTPPAQQITRPDRLLESSLPVALAPVHRTRPYPPPGDVAGGDPVPLPLPMGEVVRPIARTEGAAAPQLLLQVLHAPHKRGGGARKAFASNVRGRHDNR